MKTDIQNRVVSMLKQQRGKPIPNSPSGLPKPPDNADTSVDGQYGEEGATDPGVLHGVTGTGNGPIIGIG